MVIIYTPTVDEDSSLFQYSLLSFDSLYISSSKISTGTFIPKPGVNFYQAGALQLGPNSKIYIARPFLQRKFLVLRIQISQAPPVNYVDSALVLPNTNWFGLPNNPFAPYIQQDGCFTGTYNFHLTDTTPYQRWDFGDPQVAGDTALQVNPSYTYTQPGVYTVTCIYFNRLANL